MGIASLFEFLICFYVYIILRFDIFVNYYFVLDGHFVRCDNLMGEVCVFNTYRSKKYKKPAADKKLIYTDLKVWYTIYI